MAAQKKRWRAVLVLLLVLGALATVAAFNHASSRDAFMGDSLTQGWAFPSVNLGIYGQTSGQMLQRFPSQIPGKGYRKVFILAGTNDTLLGISPSITLENLKAMANEAQQAGAQPVLAEIPPILRSNGAYMPRVQDLNHQIVQFAAANHLRVVDYFDALNGHTSGFTDGVHLRRRNYLRMEIALLRVANPF